MGRLSLSSPEQFSRKLKMQRQAMIVTAALPVLFAVAIFTTDEFGQVGWLLLSAVVISALSFLRLAYQLCKYENYRASREFNVLRIVSYLCILLAVFALILSLAL